MTHIPPITREAMEHIREMVAQLKRPHAGCVEIIDVAAMLENWPLTPADLLDAVRARFQPKTRGGHEYEIFAQRNGLLYGMYKDSCGYGRATAWGLSGENPKAPAAELLPLSPHAALIAELRARIPINRSVDCNTDADLMQRAADALEKQP